jgi:hypothetical protein
MKRRLIAGTDSNNLKLKKINSPDKISSDYFILFFEGNIKLIEALHGKLIPN